METIYAFATAPGKSGVAVVRISGPQAKAALAAFGVALPAPRMAKLATLKRDKQAIDRALILWFPAPNSFTGEDCVELHLHGSRAVMQAVSGTLNSLKGFRLAEPGEFSRRAFENGKMDLTEAEGLADLIAAETKEQHRLAMRQMSGELHRLYEGWRAQLVEGMAFIEAYIDFPDENLPPDLAASFKHKIEKLLGEMRHHLADNHRGQRLREGIRLVILGAPNAGKSSLLNHLAQADLAIVSETPGTTRDVLSTHMDIAGYPVTLLDTAGLRDSSEKIEQEGIRRAVKNADDADIRLVLLDGETYPRIPSEVAKYLNDSVVVITKSDIGAPPGAPYISISTRTGQGISMLMELIIDQLHKLMRPGDSPALTRQRHRQLVEQAATSLEALLSAIDAPPEIHAEQLRAAAHAISALTGRIDVEDVLDALFGQFCIGK